MAKINDRRKVAMGNWLPKRAKGSVTHLVRHQTGVDVEQTMETLEGFWAREHEWDRGGYHEVIHKDGSVDLNYDPEFMTWGVGNQNGYTMHISLIGNGKFTEAQEQTFDERALYHMKNQNIPVANVWGHNEFAGHGTNKCPGINMQTVRNRLASKLQVKPKPVINSAEYTIKTGDTLWGIATANGMSVQELKAMNGLTSDIIHAGNKLKLVETQPKEDGKSIGIVNTYPESGGFRVNKTLYVFAKPDETSKHLATYRVGDEPVYYHTVHWGNGYVWLEYKRAVGGSGFIAARTYENGKFGPLFGELLPSKENTKPVAKKQTWVHLPPNNATWRIYHVNELPIAGREKGFLAPSLSKNGLDYQVLAWHDNKQTVEIQTQQLGRGKIYVGKDTNAKIYEK